MNHESTLIALNQYAADLGRFWQNFNSLEMFLRLYLARKAGMGTKDIFQCLGLDVGQSAIENPVTDWRTFGALCDEYNKGMPNPEKLDFSRVVAIRDALAHGRILGDEFGNLTVVKYSKPKAGTVSAEFKQSLSASYMQTFSDEMNDLSKNITSMMSPYMKP